MAYTTVDDPTDYFNAVLYTGNGSTNAITGVGFQPDFNWLKNRSNTGQHIIVDVVRGMNNIRPDANTAEQSNGSSHQQSLDSDGFTVAGTGANSNTNGHTFVSWNWKAGTAFSNDASSTSVGSIDSAGSVNTTAGFSIIGYTGTGSAATVAHGLGVKPSFILFKNRSRAVNWLVYDKYDGATKFLYLDVTDAVGTDSGHFNDTEPTSSVFSVGGANGTNYSGDNLIAYCFADVQGYSKIGSYVGNASTNGTYVYTGFKPAWLMVKKSAGTGSWFIKDNKRDPGNPAEETLASDSPSSAAGWGAGDDIDLLSNGFKFKDDTANINTNGDAYIYMAFAEQPFVTSTGVPATAR